MGYLASGVITWPNTHGGTDTLKVYRRDIDAGTGYQELIIVNDMIVSQALHSYRNSFYTGDGNPELVGKHIRDITGINKQRWGFKRIRTKRILEGYYEVWVQEGVEI